MNLINKIIVVGFFSLGILAQTLKVAYFPLPPFAYEEDGKAKGISVDNFKRIVSNLNWKVDFVEYPFPRILHELEKGRIDAILLLGKNDERLKIYSYPDKPSSTDHPGIAVSKSNHLKALTKALDLKGIEVGVLAKGYISPFMKDKSIKIVNLSSGMARMKSNLETLAKRRELNAVYLPTLSSLRYIGDKEGLSDQLNYLKTPEDEDFFYTVFKKDINPQVLKSYDSENTIIVKYDEKK